MWHVMFDIDGTLVDSYDVDTRCFVDAVRQVTGLEIDDDWSTYRHATDAGILQEFMDRNALPNQQDIKRSVQRVFFDQLKDAIQVQPVREIPGAAEFLAQLQAMPEVIVSMATGGWRESALMKLQSAGIVAADICLASSDDAPDRVGIMTIASERATAGQSMPCVYFGDGAWDKKACEAMQIDFVLVGDAVDHQPAIPHYQPIDKVLSLIFG